MIHSFLGDMVVLLHFTFVVFALLGGILAVRWRKIVWLHLPAALWAAVISFGGWVCPLTYLENWLRRKGGGLDYANGFVVHYIEPMLYPPGLTYNQQIFMGIVVVALNLVIYVWVLRSSVAGYLHRKQRKTG